jgi:glutathionyl-hydroquinone reductase
MLSQNEYKVNVDKRPVPQTEEILVMFRPEPCRYRLIPALDTPWRNHNSSLLRKQLQILTLRFSHQLAKGIDDGLAEA